MFGFPGVSVPSAWFPQRDELPQRGNLAPPARTLGIFEPEVNGSAPPPYPTQEEPSTARADVCGLPPSYEAARTDNAWEKLKTVGFKDRTAVLDFLEAASSMIADLGHSRDVADRAGWFTASSMVAFMSEALNVPSTTGGLTAPAGVRSAHQLAVTYAGLLAALVDAEFLMPERVFSQLIERDDVTTPYLLRLATSARSLPDASGAMCDLLETLVRTSRNPHQLRNALMSLSDTRDVRDKYTGFFDRLVGDGNLMDKEDEGAMVAIARLRRVQLWPAEKDVVAQKSSVRGKKYRHACAASDAYSMRLPLIPELYRSRQPLQRAANALWRATKDAQIDCASQRLVYPPMGRTRSLLQSTRL
ncbi:hypothetical protein SAMN05216359_101621 [Roseateles sp. YR242]|uniref:hypothetical protein n=1 Tax=Roseateles sp. YR242 TaxID=1855305 RepID=UPI0008B647B6|nr:hypothetical protein [Roseateles sp. YR242]SEK37978.1 hypothetical protein SAMN05216359_101621 [Roseateles sp. YR242]